MPGSPLLHGNGPSSTMQQVITTTESSNGPVSPRITAMPEFPPSPGKNSPKHAREPSKSFFSNLMASKSSHRLHSPEASIAEVSEKPSTRSRASSKDRSLYSVQRQESTPDLPRLKNGEGKPPSDIQESSVPSIKLQPSTDSAQSQVGTKKNKSKLGGILNRTKTVKVEDLPKTKERKPSHLNLDVRNGGGGQVGDPIRTAPIRSEHRDRAFASVDSGSMLRNRSADRNITDDASSARRERQASAIPMSSSFREGSLLSNIQQTGKGVGARFGTAGKSFFGKITRSGSSNERELVTDDNYTCTTITLPLVKQTRKTRIARRLELSKDKTEFWMPALPWRCIEYVDNLKL